MNVTGDRLVALSVRQPWAWLIIHGGKDWENRTWPTRFRGRVLIHAPKRMSSEEYWEAWNFYESQGFTTPFPIPEELEFGGVIGSVEIVDCKSYEPTIDPVEASKWLVGPWGFKLANPKACEFRRCHGMLGFFRPNFQP